MRMPRPGSETVDMWLPLRPSGSHLCDRYGGQEAWNWEDRSEAHPFVEGLGSLLLEHGEGYSGPRCCTGPGQDSCISS